MVSLKLFKNENYFQYIYRTEKEVFNIGDLLKLDPLFIVNEATSNFSYEEIKRIELKKIISKSDNDFTIFHYHARFVYDYTLVMYSSNSTPNDNSIRYEIEFSKGLVFSLKIFEDNVLTNIDDYSSFVSIENNNTIKINNSLLVNSRTFFDIKVKSLLIADDPSFESIGIVRNITYNRPNGVYYPTYKKEHINDYIKLTPIKDDKFYHYYVVLSDNLGNVSSMSKVSMIKLDEINKTIFSSNNETLFESNFDEIITIGSNKNNSFNFKVKDDFKIFSENNVIYDYNLFYSDSIVYINIPNVWSVYSREYYEREYYDICVENRCKDSSVFSDLNILPKEKAIVYIDSITILRRDVTNCVEDEKYTLNLIENSVIVKKLYRSGSKEAINISSETTFDSIIGKINEGSYVNNISVKDNIQMNKEYNYTFIFKDTFGKEKSFCSVVRKERF